MDLGNLRQSSQFRLLSLLTKIAPNDVLKDLVIHEDLMKPIDLVSGARLLREQGVDKMFKLASVAPPWKNYIRLYFIPSVYAVAENVAQQLKRHEVEKTVSYHIIVVPKVLTVIHSFFESLGVLDFVTLHSYSWDFIPLDSNLLSLELHHLFKASFLKEENSLLTSVAKALMSFECLLGKFSCVMMLGEKSQRVHNLMNAWKKEIQPNFPVETEFTHLIMLDRNIDFVSLLLTQLTYEGVLDENLKVKSGFVYLDADGVEGPQRLMLNATSDEIYGEIKGKHISAVFQHLSKKAKELQQKRDIKNTDSIEEMKNFVSHDLKKIQSQQKSLALHISACEIVMKRQAGILEELLELQEDAMSGTKMKEYLAFLEDSVARQFDLATILRLCCLYSIMEDGLPEKEYQLLQRQLLQAYGYRHLATLHYLQRLGLFNQRDSKMISLEPLLPDRFARAASLRSEHIPFRKICQRLNLLPVDESSQANPCAKSGQHPSYVFGGVYTPLVYHLVEKCVREKEPSLGDYVRCFGNNLRIGDCSHPQSSARGKVLVCFIGGVTLAEVASLDLLSRQLGRQIVVATTSTISGPDFMESIASQHTDT
ncbi:vacuolar protein sorting-associated protein 33B-like [Daphnia carinata]|uniref:vacuolar protein sorting-associated protein 33B-like n=1 Tax=Daphnia carinata TaxID=120202 RepID=UPI00257A2894|nr:vacuolar protein sorting-associated protein 33B-like [Daphnia carinata]